MVIGVIYLFTFGGGGKYLPYLLRIKHLFCLGIIFNLNKYIYEHWKDQYINYIVRDFLFFRYKFQKRIFPEKFPNGCSL